MGFLLAAKTPNAHNTVWNKCSELLKKLQKLTEWQLEKLAMENPFNVSGEKKYLQFFAILPIYHITIVVNCNLHYIVKISIIPKLEFSFMQCSRIKTPTELFILKLADILKHVRKHTNDNF